MKRIDAITQHLVNRMEELRDDLKSSSEKFAREPDMERVTYIRGTTDSMQVNNSIYMKRVGESYLEPHEIMQ